MFEIIKLESEFEIGRKLFSLLKRELLDIEGIIDIIVDEISNKKITVKYVGNKNLIRDRLMEYLNSNRKKFEADINLEGSVNCSFTCNNHTEHVSIFDEQIISNLIEHDEIRYSPDGELYYGKRLRNAIETIDSLFMKYMREFFNLDEQYSSPAIRLESLSKITDLSEVSRELMVASHFNEVKLDNIQSKSTTLKWILPAAPCLKIYLLNENKNISQNLIYSTRGICFRNESKEKYGFERMEAFNQRELIFIGDKKFVQQMIEKTMKEFTNFINKLNVFATPVPAKDPFFMNPQKRSIYDINEVIKTEFRAPLNNDNKSISVSSLDYHGTFFGQQCHIKKEGITAYSACFGIGIERLLWTYLTQNGFKSLEKLHS
ncbi:aminoacyl--tRNA ligase-related protein [Xenorhabdus bovienii]|uniref:aminoacyl--tRNA ligase-related protein n=1 Tax=Xenorhabdus bovienii TaxID=40576 RepID=UPI0023B3215D|nr:aminoacyl--tRNA ligase-related protein [Xenorhabdus bovienii]MDE9453248.1 hypothetical protein [Xenorhabdus bovienii]